MTLSAAIYQKLAADAPLVALVGQKFFPVNATEGTSGDHIIWQQVFADPANTLNEPHGSRFNLVQFICYSATSAGAEAIREALITALENQTLANGDNATLQDVRDDYEPEVKLYRADADFLF